MYVKIKSEVIYDSVESLSEDFTKQDKANAVYSFNIYFLKTKQVNQICLQKVRPTKKINK